MTSSLFACALALLVIGCKDAPGNPRLLPDAARPDQVLDFATLYRQNCSACHGERGHNGASISLANPVYIAVAGEGAIEHTIAAGVPGTLMPAFSRAGGGILTDQQIAALAHDMVKTWSNPSALGGQSPPPYAAALHANAVQGQKSFLVFCAGCHGEDGAGTAAHPGSIVDSSYLALVNDQYLRSTIIAGRVEGPMPNWHSYEVASANRIMTDRSMTDQEITDIVAWLATHRTATPGQPYPTQSTPSGATHE